VLTLPILVGTDGHMRMSKTTGNYVGIDEAPNEMYGKVMSIPDHAMLNFYTLVTRFRPHEISAVERGLADGSLHPRDAKMKLAREIVSGFYGDDAAVQAEAHFQQVFQQGDLPEDMPVYTLAQGTTPNVVDLLVAAGLVASKSQARRLIAQGGVRLDGTKVEGLDQVVDGAEAQVLQVGKRKFVQIIRA
jgi:tyrosyl-tRNA synthetase